MLCSEEKKVDARRALFYSKNIPRSFLYFQDLGFSIYKQ